MDVQIVLSIPLITLSLSKKGQKIAPNTLLSVTVSWNCVLLVSPLRSLPHYRKQPYTVSNHWSIFYPISIDRQQLTRISVRKIFLGSIWRGQHATISAASKFVFVLFWFVDFVLLFALIFNVSHLGLYRSALLYMEFLYTDLTQLKWPLQTTVLKTSSLQQKKSNNESYHAVLPLSLAKAVGPF